MIFINSNADYSNAAIDHITIPVYDYDATEIMSHYTKNVSDKVRYAFAQFCIDMKTANMWENINSMFVPILAGTKHEVIYETMSGILHYPDYEEDHFKNFGLSKYGSSTKYISNLTDSEYFVEYIDTQVYSRTLIAGHIGRLNNVQDAIINTEIGYCLGVGYSPKLGQPLVRITGGNTGVSNGVCSSLVYMGYSNPDLTVETIVPQIRTIRNGVLYSGPFEHSMSSSTILHNFESLGIGTYGYQNYQFANSSNTATSIVLTLNVKAYTDEQLLSVDAAVNKFINSVYENDANDFIITY